MTAQEKRDYVRLVSEKSLRYFLPDPGAQRALDLIRGGSDAYIAGVFDEFFADCWRRDNFTKSVYNSVRT